MAEPWFKSFTWNGSFVRVSATPLVLDAQFIVPAENTGNVEIRADGGTSAVIVSGSFTLRGVDLSRIEIKGALGTTTTVIAQSSVRD